MIFAKLKTLINLGIYNSIIVILYRLRLKLNIHPVCNIESFVPSGPFFTESKLHTLAIPSAATWNNSISLFSHIEIPLFNDKPNWLSNPINKSISQSNLKPWWKISDFDENTGDIKIIWEQSRMDWVLAFAQRVRNGDKNELKKLNIWLDDWLIINPPYLGINWKCGQEASIRVINLCCALLILGQEKHSLSSFEELIRMHLLRIAPTINYAIAQNNNHGTSEAAALFIGGSLLTSLGALDGKSFEKKGRYWLENRAANLIEQDGSFSQYSLNYHRMMLDTISFSEIWRQKLALVPFSACFYQRANNASSWLYQMISPITGDGPNMGANDGSNLLQLSGSSYRDYRPSVHLAMTLFQERPAYKEKGLWNNHLIWLGVSEAKRKMLEYTDCNYDDGGYKIIHFNNASAFLRFPNFRYRPSQADALHVDFWVNGINLLGDAGSYSYNSEPDLSDYFAGTKGHNTIQFDNRNQMPRLSRFLFGEWLKPSIVNNIYRENDEVSCKAGYIDYKNAKHVRKVYLNKDTLCVEDEVKGFKKKAILRWRLPDDSWVLKKTSKGITVEGINSILSVNSTVPILNSTLTNGWESNFYMQKKTTVILEVEISKTGNFVTEYQWIK